ncbi:MAG: zinc ribbon domain-containing protein, partial [Acutalibacteraceae bacterium]|nr:zinc ribbon domain-containing protein [Acutalibacteraceae bacterium]
MALIKCPECGKEISDTAKNCINCGYMLKEENKVVKKKSKKGLFILLAIVVVILGFVLKFEISDAIEKRNDRIESQTPGEKLIVQTYCQDVESNEMNAEKKYIGNRYYIIGTIQDIERFGTEIEVDVIDSDSGKRFTFYPYD